MTLADLLTAAEQGRLGYLVHLTSPLPGLGGVVPDLGEYVRAQ
jgi:hypothetical protein